MRYSISEFAGIVGVTTDTLRLYEKYNIINPKRDEQNNYRYYDDLDVRDLLMSRWYRSMDVSLQDSSKLIKGSSKEEIFKELKKRQLQLEKELRLKAKLLNRITEITEEIKDIDKKIGKCEKRKTLGIYRLKQTEENKLLENDFIIKSVDNWMNTLPHTFYSFHIEGGLLDKNICLNYNWGLAIKEEDVENFNIELNDYIEYIPGQLSVTSIIESPHQQYLDKEYFQFMIDYINKNNYKMLGSIYGRILFTETKNNMKKSFLEVNIPIG